MTAPAVDCLVIGAGPAGLTAAMYLRRYHRSVQLVDHGHSRALKIDRSHNVPGFPQGIAGAELLDRMRQQLHAFDGSVVTAEVKSLARGDDGIFVASVEAGADAGGEVGGEISALTVLMASGVVDGIPPLSGIDDVHGAGLVRQCPICDGHEHRGRRIAVIGNGAHAARESRFIAHYSDRVACAGVGECVPPVDPAGSSQVLALGAPAVGVERLDDGALRLRLADGSHHDCDVIYAAMGVQPRSDLARSLGAEVDALGSLRVDAHGRTNVAGLYAAGDVTAGLDQISVAAAQGAIAATAIHNALPVTGPGDPPAGSHVAARSSVPDATAATKQATP